MYLIRLLLDPRGRIGRDDFLIAHLTYLFGFMIFLFIFSAMHEKVIYESLFSSLFLLGWMTVIISSIFIMIKRFRDLEMNKWNVLWTFVPIFNLYYYYLLFCRSRKAELTFLEKIKGIN